MISIHYSTPHAAKYFRGDGWYLTCTSQFAGLSLLSPTSRGWRKKYGIVTVFSLQVRGTGLGGRGALSVFVHGHLKASKSYSLSYTIQQVALQPPLLFSFASPSMMPFPVAARSKAWLYRRWLIGIAGSNLVGDRDVYLV
jgi:hypothetical protein